MRQARCEFYTESFYWLAHLALDQDSDSAARPGLTIFFFYSFFFAFCLLSSFYTSILFAPRNLTHVAAFFFLFLSFNGTSLISRFIQYLNKLLQRTCSRNGEKGFVLIFNGDANKGNTVVARHEFIVFT